MIESAKCCASSWSDSRKPPMFDSYFPTMDTIEMLMRHIDPENLPAEYLRAITFEFRGESFCLVGDAIHLFKMGHSSEFKNIEYVPHYKHVIDAAMSNFVFITMMAEAELDDE
jgi:hypothetical protein